MVMDGDSLRRIGDSVVARRKVMRWSQADLVRASKINDLTLRRIEKGKPVDYRNNTWQKLCDALHWSDDSIDLIVAGQEPLVVDPEPPADKWEAVDKRLTALEARVRNLMRLADEDALRREPPESPPPED